ncbi:MAG: o-succinylbenzoate synthase [Actinobacteria bacterium]|uniref:o-succinylbenzoate synthase n=1 Tax=freshwater metagenome TaxID=449393 RepID=A0A6J7T6A2_9ZZZZ|nr:o-succinylbenzoate synthase [Actinomycetota bacterium]
MRIERIRVVRVPLVLVSPLRTSDGAHQSRSAVLVEITDSDGFVGWGENVAPTGVRYVGEHAEASFAAMTQLLIPELVQHDVAVADLFTDGWWGIQGNHFAKHALESALWDVHARRQEKSLAEILGAVETEIQVGVVVGTHDSIDDVVAEVMMRVEEGYARVKVKIAPGHDVDVLAAVRDAVGVEYAIQADANGAYGADDIDLLCSLDKFALQFIEQPFATDDLDSHAELLHRSATSVCLDESVNSMSELLNALDRGACDVVNIKPSRVGGIRDAIAMHDVLVDRGIDAWVGGMLESGIGRASCLAIAAMPGFTLTPDLSASARYFATDITTPFVLNEGMLKVPTGFGIGVEPLPEVLAGDGVVIETLFQH